MAQIRDAVKKQARDIIIGLLRKQFKKKSSRYEVTKMVDRILSITEVAEGLELLETVKQGG